MRQRLGRVLYWTACVAAITIIAAAAGLIYTSRSLSPHEATLAGAFAFVSALSLWTIGFAIREMLSDD